MRCCRQRSRYSADFGANELYFDPGICYKEAGICYKPGHTIESVTATPLLFQK